MANAFKFETRKLCKINLKIKLTRKHELNNIQEHSFEGAFLMRKLVRPTIIGRY